MLLFITVFQKHSTVFRLTVKVSGCAGWLHHDFSFWTHRHGGGGKEHWGRVYKTRPTWTQTRRPSLPSFQTSYLSHILGLCWEYGSKTILFIISHTFSRFFFCSFFPPKFTAPLTVLMWNVTKRVLSESFSGNKVIVFRLRTGSGLLQGKAWTCGWKINVWETFKGAICKYFRLKHFLKM